MKKLLVLMFCFLLMASFMGCGQKAEEGADDTAAHGQAEEVADTTRMDSAAVDSMMPDTTMMDTAAAAEEGGQ